MTTMIRRRGKRARRGFTLIEMMIAIVLTVLVMGALMIALVRQQRFYTGAAQLLDARSQVRQASAILPNDIRALSTVGGDIVAMDETELVVRATYGSSVICAISGGNVIVPPVDPAAGNVVTFWSAVPATGDTVFIFNEGPTTNASDDSWAAGEIGNTVTWETGTCPTSTGLTTAADASKSLLKFNLVNALPADVTVGAPMRYVRRAVYRLFEAPNGEWYLGYCSPGCGNTDPEVIAGPFVAFDGADGPGVRFTYLDRNGVETATASQVARISILVSARTKPGAGLTGFQTTVLGDSLRFAVAIRNQQ
jgi:prepilin-type N-terminal cleavage/methylation domain-containing protein